MPKSKGKAKAAMAKDTKPPALSEKMKGKAKAPPPKMKKMSFKSMPTPVIEGDSRIVKDLFAFDGERERFVGTKILRNGEALSDHPAKWAAAWYIWEAGHWVTLGSKERKAAALDVFDVRKLFVEDPEYAFVDPNDPDWELWAKMPAPGQHNGRTYGLTW